MYDIQPIWFVVFSTYVWRLPKSVLIQQSTMSDLILSRSLPPVKLWQGHRIACHSVRNFTEPWNWFWRFDLAWGCPSECSRAGIDRNLHPYARGFSIPNPETCGVSESDRYACLRTRYEGWTARSQTQCSAAYGPCGASRLAGSREGTLWTLPDLDWT